MMAAGKAVAIDPPRRRLTMALLLGIYLMPAAFVWLLFRRGYSPALRRGGIAWLIFNLLPGLAVILAA